MRQSTLDFNQELLAGEFGALLLANVAVPVVSHFKSTASVLSAVAVVATLIGGSLTWIVARVRHQMRAKTFAVKTMASDVTHFTPAALFFGFCVYDPVIYLFSHYLLLQGFGAWLAVFAAQLAAFALFLLSLNLYRLSLFRLRGKAL